MTPTLVVCDHAKHRLSQRQFDQVLHVNQSPPDRNLRLQIHNVSHWLLRQLNPVALDLLNIAACVYHADSSVKRGSAMDVFHEDWARDFTFIIPVHEPDVWQQGDVSDLLGETLEFLTDDRCRFIFTARGKGTEQLVFEKFSRDLPPAPEADCVSLFSGGMDSLAGAIHLHSVGRKPILVSHRSRSHLVQLQQRLVAPLRKHFPDWTFPHLGVWINRVGPRAAEETQRSRSFLFAALGALVAHELGIRELDICENGITSFNLPRTGQTLGATATRSTHPRFLGLFQQLASMVFGSELKVQSPFLWKTRTEVMEVLKQNHSADLLPLTSSCAHSQRPKIHPHCGTCSQCVDRRFAAIHAGLDVPDEVQTFEKDIFTDPLGDGVERMQAMSPIQFALDVRRRDENSFHEKYVQVFDAIIGLDPDEAERTLKSIYDLHRRYADEIQGVMVKEYATHWDKVHGQELPATCLLMLDTPHSNYRTDANVAARATELADRLRKCQVSKGKALEDLCGEVLTFLFCEGVDSARVLMPPVAQSTTDSEYRRRDLVFENRAGEGFWADVRHECGASGVIVDAKNYKHEIDGQTVVDFSTKYLKKVGLGRFGIILARKVPEDVKGPVSRNTRLSGAVEEQKNQWRDGERMVVLLGEEDIIEMLHMKAFGKDPTELLRARVFALKARM